MMRHERWIISLIMAAFLGVGIGCTREEKRLPENYGFQSSAERMPARDAESEDAGLAPAEQASTVTVDLAGWTAVAHVPDWRDPAHHRVESVLSGLPVAQKSVGPHHKVYVREQDAERAREALRDLLERGHLNFEVLE